MVDPVSGIRNTWRFLVLLVSCLVVAAPVTAQARTSDSHCEKVGALTICPTLNTVKVSFQTPQRTSASITTSRGNASLTVIDARFKKTHTVTIPERPQTTYAIKVIATPLKGRLLTYRGSFTTDAPGSVLAQITKSPTGNKLALNGVKTFVTNVMAGNCPTQSNVGVGMSLQVMVLSGTTCFADPSNPQPPVPSLQSWLNNEAWWHEQDPANIPKLTGLTGLLTWRTSVLQDGILPAITPCASTASLSAWIVKQATLIRAGASKAPEMPVVWVASKLKNDMSNCLNDSPQWLNAYFWIAVINGAAGITYDPHQPIFSGDAPNYVITTAVRGQILAQGNCMSVVGTAMMNGKPLTVTVTGNPNVVARAWNYSGVTYVVAVNPGTAPGTATMSIPRLRGKSTVQTTCEAPRRLTLTGSLLTDSFGAAGVHLYEVIPAIGKK